MTEILAALDTETSGLDRQKCELLSLALVPLNRDFSFSDIPAFTARINPQSFLRYCFR